MFVIVIFGLLGSLGQAVPVVEWNTVRYVGRPGSFGLFTEIPSAGGMGADIVGLLTYDSGGMWVDIDVETGTIGVAHKWFKMEYGELMDAVSTETADPFAIIYFSDMEYYSARLDLNQPFYLGFQLGSTEYFPNYAQYGWVELIYDGNTINYVSSATERTGLGIYVGTGTAIPEPSTVGLLVIGAVVMTTKYLKRKVAQTS